MEKITYFSLSKIEELVKEQGYQAKTSVDSQLAYIQSSTGGIGFNIYALDHDYKIITDITKDASIIMFRSGWYNLEGFDEQVLLKICNDRNANRLVGKAYVSQINDTFAVFFERELLLLDGISLPAFVFVFKNYTHALEMFGKTIVRPNTDITEELLLNHERALQILHGNDNTPNVDEAIDLYRYNSHLGYAGSQNNLGDLFENGKLVQKNELIAMYWYTRAAERGEPTAYLSIASLLSSHTANLDALFLATKYSILASKALPEGKNKLSAQELHTHFKSLLTAKQYQYAEALVSNHKPLYQEKWLMGDAPGPQVSLIPGSNLIN